MENAAANSDRVLQRVTPDQADYPTHLQRCPSFKSAPALSALGNLGLLHRSTVALFCSHNCPDELVAQAHELVQLPQALNLVPIGGFHTPVEQSWLNHLFASSTALIHCPARSLTDFPLSPQQSEAIQAERLLLLSPFPPSARRATVQLAAKRNALVGSLATAVVIAYAAPDSKTAGLAQALIQMGRPVFTLSNPHNRVLLELGARGIGKIGEMGEMGEMGKIGAFFGFPSLHPTSS